jgi:hypothetical protein
MSGLRPRGFQPLPIKKPPGFGEVFSNKGLLTYFFFAAFLAAFLGAAFFAAFLGAAFFAAFLGAAFLAAFFAAFAIFFEFKLVSNVLCQT